MSYNLTFTDAGVYAPSTAEIKADIQTLFQEILGVDCQLDDASVNGQLITAFTKIIAEKNAQMLFIVNQFDPEKASGKWQDALAKIYFLTRNPATYSTVQCVCTGAAGTVLNGASSSDPAMAANGNGDLFVCLDGGVIPSEGSITLTFRAEKSGPVTIGANTVNKIYSQVNGWDTVTNPIAGSVGVSIESQFDFEQRRKRSIALNSTGNVDSVYSRVSEVNGVTDCDVVENDEDTTRTIKGVSVDPHSIYVVVNGGESSAIAQAIRKSKSGGCGTTGDISVQLPESFLPIKFNRSSDVSVFVSVSISDTLTPSVAAGVKKAIIANFNGTDDYGSRVSLGATLFASRFYAPLFTAGYKNVLSVKVGLSSSEQLDDLMFAINQKPVLDVENITVTGE